MDGGCGAESVRVSGKASTRKFYPGPVGAGAGERPATGYLSGFVQEEVSSNTSQVNTYCPERQF